MQKRFEKQTKSDDKLRVEHKFTHQQKQHVLLAGDHMSVSGDGERARGTGTQTTYYNNRQPCESTEKDVHIRFSKPQPARQKIQENHILFSIIIPSSSRHLCTMCNVHESWVQFLVFVHIVDVDFVGVFILFFFRFRFVHASEIL